MTDTPSIDAESRQTQSNAEVAARWKIDPHQDPYSIELGKLNPGHGAYFAANTAMGLFDRLHKEAPVHRTEESQYGAYWNITSFDAVKQVDTNPKLFSSSAMNGGIRLGGQRLEEPDPTMTLPMFIMQDAPVHDEQRKAVAPMFTPRNLAGFESLIRSRAADILDGLPRNQDFDWVSQVSVELTSRMLATLFDVPQEDRHKLIHWSDTVERLADPEYFDTVEEGMQEIWGCFEYFSEAWKDRSGAREPGLDLISFLANGEATKEMPPNEFLGNVLLLIVAGNDTTRNSISAGVLGLNRFPEEYDKLRKNPDLIPNMVPEIIRWHSPVAHMCRTAMADTELGGKKIHQWDRICMWYLAGNHDKNKIENPSQLLIDRKNARQHLGFGFGIHRCLGNRLAEMQLRVLWEEVMKRFEQVEVVGQPQFLNSSFIHGITDLPVRVHDR